MRFFLKLLLYAGIAVGGSGLAVNQIPSLRANIIETVNPRAKEARLINELQQHLEQVDTQLVQTSGTAPSGSSSMARTIQEIKEVIEKSKSLVSEIETINQENSGLVENGVSVLVNTLASTATPSPVSTSTIIPPGASSTLVPCRTP